MAKKAAPERSRVSIEYLVRSQSYIELLCQHHGSYVKHPETPIHDRVCPMCLTTGRIS